MISDPKIAVNNIFQMLENNGIKTIGGNFLKLILILFVSTVMVKMQFKLLK